MTEEELKQRIRALKKEGKGYAKIAKELGISPSKAWRLVKDEPVTVTPAVEEGEPFLDSETRFASLLGSYGIKDGSRIVSYISTQGENVYSDLETLKRALVEQGVAAGKVGPIVKHWAAIEQLPIPQRLVAEISAEAPGARLPQRWTVMDGRPIPDEEGEYDTFAKALKVAQMERQPQTQGDSGVKELRAELAGLRESLTNAQIASLQDRLDQQAQAHQRQLDAILDQMQKDRIGRTEMDILHELAIGSISEAKAWRVAIKEGIIDQGRLPPPMTPGQRAERTEKLRQAVQTDREIEEIGRRLFFGEGVPGKESKPAQPPPPSAPTSMTFE